MKRRDELSEAEKTKKSLEQTLSSGEEAFKTAEQHALEKNALETEAGARLESHRVKLEGLDAELTVNHEKARDTELQQLELAKRLS